MGSKVTEMVRRRRSIAVVLVVAALAATGWAASTAAGKSQEDVTLTVSLFGDFGYHDLYEQYEAAHPGVTIKESIQDFAVHHSNLAKSVATGAGAADVEAIEVGFIAQFKSQPQNFVNLRQYGAGALKSRWLDWKWAQGLGSKGEVVGLGTDVGSLAICYRRDLFQKAGLPSKRAEVSKLWPTWRAFINTGKRFQAKAPKGVTFFDSGSNVFNAIIGQATPAYYDASGKVIVATNPRVKAAWELTMLGLANGESAGFAAFSNDWNTGYKKGSFATVTCPAWMMGYIQGQAPATKGKWDIAATPGTGGNWGGSYLAVPKQSKNAAMAADLVKFLTSPSSESFVFKQTGNLPSQPALLKSKAVAGFKNPFFNNAPVGQIFANSALRLKPQIIGPQQGAIQTASSNAIQRVEQKKQSPAKSWAQFLKDVKALAPRARAGRGAPPPPPPPPPPAREDEENDMSDGAAAAPTTVVRHRSATRRRLRRADAKVSPYLYIAPFFVLFAIFGIFPLLYTAWVSLTDRNLLAADSNFIGLDNYSALLHDEYFWHSVVNTLGIWVLSTIPQLALALVIAHVLNRSLRVRTFFRMSILLPQVTSLVAVALIFTQLFGYRYGLVNYLLNQVGIENVNWEAGRISSWVALSTMVTWRWVGYNALLYLAAMQSIPDDLYEASAIDGARSWRQFIHVTVPMLRPTIIFTVIISTIGGLQLFTEPFLFQPVQSGSTGGSARQYQTVSMYLYEKAFGGTQFDFGYAAAIAWCLFLLIAVFSFLNYLLVRRIRSADV